MESCLIHKQRITNLLFHRLRYYAMAAATVTPIPAPANETAYLKQD